MTTHVPTYVYSFTCSALLKKMLLLLGSFLSSIKEHVPTYVYSFTCSTPIKIMLLLLGQFLSKNSLGIKEQWRISRPLAITSNSQSYKLKIGIFCLLAADVGPLIYYLNKIDQLISKTNLIRKNDKNII